MKTFRNTVHAVVVASLLAVPALPAWSQEAPAPERKDRSTALAWMLGPDDVLLPITSVEWGAPDRWSFTSRYAHMFDKDRDNKPWLNNFTISLSPGTDGGRFGIGWQGIYSLKKGSDLGIFAEARAVLLRTWGHPLQTGADRTFAGAEIRGALGFVCNLGVGWYRQISSHEGPADSFWGVHIGIGI